MTNIICRNFIPFSSHSHYSHSLCSFDCMLHFRARNKVQMPNKAIKNDIVDGHKIHGNSCGLINHAHHPIPVALCSATLFVFGKIDSGLIIHFLVSQRFNSKWTIFSRFKIREIHFTPPPIRIRLFSNLAAFALCIQTEEKLKLLFKKQIQISESETERVRERAKERKRKK